MAYDWDIKKIREILPQKYPFLFIDKVIDFDETKGRITCLKNLTINDYFFEGHFPDNPILPGVIIIEAMAQAGILLFAALKPGIAARKPDYFLGKVDIKFLKPAKPGDQLILEIEKGKIVSTAGIVKAKATVNNDTIAEGEIVFGVR
jgi:3-hydroxyacyl-[acyl-carrier-protein] dehydratase